MERTDYGWKRLKISSSDKEKAISIIKNFPNAPSNLVNWFSEIVDKGTYSSHMITSYEAKWLALAFFVVSKITNKEIVFISHKASIRDNNLVYVFPEDNDKNMVYVFHTVEKRGSNLPLGYADSVEKIFFGAYKKACNYVKEWLVQQ